jgi:hypothetical protein
MEIIKNDINKKLIGNSIRGITYCIPIKEKDIITDSKIKKLAEMTVKKPTCEYMYYIMNKDKYQHY